MTKNEAHEFINKLNADIEGSMATSLYLTAFADLTDELDCPLGGGADYVDSSGETPPSYKFEAAFLTGKIEHLNNKSMADLYLQAIETDGIQDTDKNRDDFGHYMVMESLGHGVSWEDDHETFPRIMPHYEHTITTPNREAVLSNTSFDPTTLDIEDEREQESLDTFLNLPENDEINPFLLRDAVGIARGMISNEIKDEVDSKSAQKALLVNNVVKNDDIVLAGFRILGASHEANRNANIYGMLSDPSAQENAAYKLIPQDVEKYKATVNESSISPDHPYARTTEARIQGGQRLHDFVINGVEYPEFPNALKPAFFRDYSTITDAIVRHHKPESPSFQP